MVKVDTMRRVDYWVGIPLCFLLTPVVWLLDAFKLSQRKNDKVLLIELSEMGSAILVDPAMEKLKQNGKELFFLIFKKNKMSLDLLNTVPKNNIFTLRESSLLVLTIDTLKFIWWSRKNKISTVIDLELFSRFTALLVGACGASKRVGFHPYHNEGVFRGGIHNYKVWYNSHIHIAKNFLCLAHAALSEKKEVPFAKVLISDDEVQLKKAVVPSEMKEDVRRKIAKEFSEGWDAEESPLILINANASDLLPQRRWSKKSYIKLIKKILHETPQVKVLLTGAPAEREGLEEIVLGVNDSRCINFAGKVKFMELLGLYSLATLMVSNDSGPPHFASTLGLLTFTIFGPETPQLYGAIGEQSHSIYLGLSCSPCVSAWNHRKTPCKVNECLLQLDAERVFQEVKKHWSFA